MKLIKVIIYNLASLEGLHEIDFESEPLRSAEAVASRPFSTPFAWRFMGRRPALRGLSISSIIMGRRSTRISRSRPTTRVTSCGGERKAARPRSGSRPGMANIIRRSGPAPSPGQTIRMKSGGSIVSNGKERSSRRIRSCRSGRKVRGETPVWTGLSVWIITNLPGR